MEPHGLKHTAINVSIWKLKAAGMDLTKVLQFPRHRDVNTLQICIYQVGDVERKVVELASTI